MTGTAVPSSGQAARIGALVALIGLVLDQISKHWVLDIARLGETGPIFLGPFVDLRLVWNPGVSYGLFPQGTDVGRWALVAISILASLGLALWLTRAASRLVAISVGLVLAGAIGNAIDRGIYGAVIDFVYLHSPDRSLTWYVFNLADAWIVVGVAGLLYDSLFGARRAGA